MNKKPYIALGVTHKCNYNCIYCNPIGENFGTEARELPFSFWKDVIDAAYDAGIKTFRITGGEPLLRKDIVEILTYIDQFEDTRINLCTNGSLLDRFLDSLIKLERLNEIRISIDTIKPTPGFPKILNRRKISIIKKLKTSGVNVRINTVVTKINLNQIVSIIDFCVKEGIDIKLLDLYYDFPEDIEFWKNNFIDLEIFHIILQNKGAKLLEKYNVDGGYGIPMYAYKIGSTRVIFKDSKKGTHYTNSCKKCPRYPCQEGFYTPFVSSDGTLHPSHCTFKKFTYKLNNKTKEEMAFYIKTLLSYFDPSQLYIANDFYKKYISTLK